VRLFSLESELCLDSRKNLLLHLDGCLVDFMPRRVEKLCISEDQHHRLLEFKSSSNGIFGGLILQSHSNREEVHWSLNAVVITLCFFF